MVPVVTVTVGLLMTVTVEVVVPKQPPVAAVIVYTVVTPGFAVTVDPVVELRPVPGFQV
jgi:hypothetical protein